ncbi:MAG: hypothetical protein JWQ65_1733 [Devosia sp.]|nr:hypothetical protein [Devosia sp.]
MKLTWFGGTTMRVHIGGAMLVIDAAGAPAGIDRTELVSGADRQVSFADLDGLDAIDPARWAPRKVPALIDESDLPAVAVYREGDTAILLDAVGEQPLLIVTGQIERMGRWAANGVVVVAGASEALPGLAANVLERLGPKLIAVAGPEAAVDAVILRVKDELHGTGLMALEPGLALEV